MTFAVAATISLGAAGPAAGDTAIDVAGIVNPLLARLGELNWGSDIVDPGLRVLRRRGARSRQRI